MEMRAENRRPPITDRTLTGLTINVAALLCYVGGWITGIIFLVLEKKNHYIRFHAIQSIIVFGILTLASAVLGSIPVIGIGFHWVMSVTGFVLWIILMVKAAGGEYYKLPWAGDLADRFATESPGRSARQSAGEVKTAEFIEAQSVSPPIIRYNGRDEFKARYYSMGAKAGRITASAFVIAWSVIFLIFFNFYNQYIAYYQPVYSGNTTQWQMYTLITADFYDWLPILTVTLVLSIICHAFLIVYDKYILRQIIRLALAVFGVATVVGLLVIFPFNFNAIPNADAAFWAPIGLTITLIMIAGGIGIGALVRFIQLIIHTVQGRY